MKIIVLHGEDINKSYERLRKFTDAAKKRNWEIIYDDISRTPSLFGNERLTVVRDYKLLGKKTVDGTLVIYHEGTMPATFLKTLPKDTKNGHTVVIEEFKLPKMLWNFLDNMSIKSFHEVIKIEPVEFVFIMIAWKFKKRYLASPSPKVKEILNKLAQIDVDVKTGKADLVSSLDLLFIKELE